MTKKVYSNLRYKDRCKIETMKETKISNTRIAQQKLSPHILFQF